MKESRKTGIMSAMPEEIRGVEEFIDDIVIEKLGHHTYYSGTINSNPVVLVFSGWGKVAAAATVSALIHRFGVSEILFTGVAGAIAPGLRIGDIVLADELVQHDMDARPLFQRFEIPLLKRSFFSTDVALLQMMKEKITALLETASMQKIIGEEACREFNLSSPRLIIGNIASGDQFINDSLQGERILNMLPSVQCVEMEGAAVAQVCYENSIPFLVIRTISDVADAQSHVDFASFVSHVSCKFSIEFVKQYFMLENPVVNRSI